MPGRVMSETYSACPVTLATPSTRAAAVPMIFMVSALLEGTGGLWRGRV